MSSAIDERIINHQLKIITESFELSFNNDVTSFITLVSPFTQVRQIIKTYFLPTTFLISKYGGEFVLRNLFFFFYMTLVNMFQFHLSYRKRLLVSPPCEYKLSFCQQSHAWCYQRTPRSQLFNVEYLRSSTIQRCEST